MKRTISICLLLLCVLSSSAQIQRNFLGFTLGESTKEQVYNELVKQNFDVWGDPNFDTYVVNDHIPFAGYIWTTLSVSFYNNRLYNITFIDGDSTTEALIDKFIQINQSLNKKYIDYLISDATTVKHYEDSDTHIMLQCDYSSISSKVQLSLTYAYMPLLKLKKSQEEDEL